MKKVTEKYLYENGDCPSYGCGGCPFWDSPLEKKYRNVNESSICYDIFKKYYEKKQVIDHVLNGEDNA